MKYTKKRIDASRLSRFLVGGAINTMIDLIVLNEVFYGLHSGKILPSIIATCCIILFSIALNRQYVFRDKAHLVKKPALFGAFAALGTLFEQTATYAVSMLLLRQCATTDFAFNYLSTTTASVGILPWNYNDYRLIIFKGNIYQKARTYESFEQALHP
jgi:putative flippase GtrA